MRSAHTARRLYIQSLAITSALHAIQHSIIRINRRDLLNTEKVFKDDRTIFMPILNMLFCNRVPHVHNSVLLVALHNAPFYSYRLDPGNSNHPIAGTFR